MDVFCDIKLDLNSSSDTAPAHGDVSSKRGGEDIEFNKGAALTADDEMISSDDTNKDRILLSKPPPPSRRPC